MERMGVRELEYRGVDFSFQPMLNEDGEGKKVKFVMEAFFIDDLI